MSLAATIKALPQSVLDTTPAGAPPPGVIPNFVHPPSYRTEPIIVCSVFIGIAVAFFAVRLYVKVRIVRAVAIEDFLCLAGLLFSLAQYAGIVLNCTQGTGGYHLWDTTLAQTFSRPNLIAGWMTVVFVTPALGFVKMTFFVQYYKLFWPFRWVRWTVWIGGITAGIFYFAVTIAMFVVSSPRIGEEWIDALLKSHYEITSTLSIPIGAVGAAVDLFLLILPIRAVMELKLQHSTKVGLVIIFATGGLAAMASIVGLAYRVLTQRHYSDAEWWVAKVYLWMIIELSAGVICSCMPSVSKLLQSSGMSTKVSQYMRGLSSGSKTTGASTSVTSKGSKRFLNKSSDDGKWYALETQSSSTHQDNAERGNAHGMRVIREFEVIREPGLAQSKISDNVPAVPPLRHW